MLLRESLGLSGFIRCRVSWPIRVGLEFECGLERVEVYLLAIAKLETPTL